MNNLAAARSTFKSEMLLLLGIVLGLGIIAAFFYWWGSADQGFSKRKATVLLNQLARVTDERPSQTGMSLFVSFSKEADTTGRLLDGDLDPETWLRVARQRANAICTLISMGDVARTPELASLCSKLKSSGDERARELGHAAQCSLDFERQYVLCKHKMIVAEIIAAAAADKNGDAGQKLVQRIRDHQQTDWKMTKIVPELLTLAKALPAGNQLTPYVDRYLSQLIDIECSLESESTLPAFTDWIQQAQDLVGRYPKNVEVCRAIVKNYDRLSDLRCYDEAQQLLAATLTGYEESGASEVKDDVEKLIDRRSAAQIQLDRWEALVRSNPAAAGALVEPIKLGAQRLLANQLVSNGVVDSFIEVAETMENTQQYDSLAKVRAALLEVFATNDTVSNRFKNYCAASSKRAALVGKPFLLPSSIAVDKELDSAIFAGRATAVVFWASEEPGSLEMLQQLDQLYTRRKNVGFGMIAVNVDQNLELVRTMMSQHAPEWTVVVASGPDATGRNPLAVEYGIHKTPYLILVDSQGVVVDVALGLKDMWRRASELLPGLNADESSR